MGRHLWHSETDPGHVAARDRIAEGDESRTSHQVGDGGEESAELWRSGPWSSIGPRVPRHDEETQEERGRVPSPLGHSEGHEEPGIERVRPFIDDGVTEEKATRHEGAKEIGHRVIAALLRANRGRFD